MCITHHRYFISKSVLWDTFNALKWQRKRWEHESLTGEKGRMVRNIGKINSLSF